MLAAALILSLLVKHVTYIDFNEAFNKVSHEWHSWKLISYDITGPLFSSIKDSRTGRPAATKVNGVFPDMMHVMSVPSGFTS